MIDRRLAPGYGLCIRSATWIGALTALCLRQQCIDLIDHRIAFDLEPRTPELLRLALAEPEFQVLDRPELQCDRALLVPLLITMPLLLVSMITLSDLFNTRPLQQAGLQLDSHTFPDHHAFRPEDIRFGDGRPVIMTEKDAVKCRHFATQDDWYVPVEASLSGKFREQLDALLDTRLSHRG